MASIANSCAFFCAIAIMSAAFSSASRSVCSDSLRALVTISLACSCACRVIRFSSVSLLWYALACWMISSDFCWASSKMRCRSLTIRPASTSCEGIASRNSSIRRAMSSSSTSRLFVNGTRPDSNRIFSISSKISSTFMNATSFLTPGRSTGEQSVLPHWPEPVRESSRQTWPVLWSLKS